MALVHDMAECIAGDITPHCGVTDEEKFKLEKAVSMICTVLDLKIVLGHLFGSTSSVFTI